MKTHVFAKRKLFQLRSIYSPRLCIQYKIEDWIELRILFSDFQDDLEFWFKFSFSGYF